MPEEGGETHEGSAGGGGWQQIPRAERWALASIFLVLLGLRVLYACCMTFNSDEAQHLHVVWGWATAHLQYKEVFDNHTPLFHILCAPVFRLFPETAMIIIYMRLAMIPIFACGIWFVARIGERLFSRRVGLWTAVFTGFAPLFFLKTVEFRTDDLWTVLWLGALMVAVEGRFTPKRMFVLGIMLGAAFSVSMKTVLMLLGVDARDGSGLLVLAKKRRRVEGPRRGVWRWSLPGRNTDRPRADHRIFRESRCAWADVSMRDPAQHRARSAARRAF